MDFLRERNLTVNNLTHGDGLKKSLLGFYVEKRPTLVLSHYKVSVFYKIRGKKICPVQKVVVKVIPGNVWERSCRAQKRGWA